MPKISKSQANEFIKKQTLDFYRKLDKNIKKTIKEIEIAKKQGKNKLIYDENDENIANFFFSQGYSIRVDNYLDYDITISWNNDNNKADFTRLN